jgi:hypothetical protein
MSDQYKTATLQQASLNDLMYAFEGSLQKERRAVLSVSISSVVRHARTSSNKPGQARAWRTIVRFFSRLDGRNSRKSASVPAHRDALVSADMQNCDGSLSWTLDNGHCLVLTYACFELQSDHSRLRTIIKQLEGLDRSHCRGFEEPITCMDTADRLLSVR